MSSNSDTDYLVFQRICVAEHDIITRLYADNKVTCHFNYRAIESEGCINYILAIATFNPRHLQTFNFFITDKHPTKIECLDQAKVYLDRIHSKDSDYFSFQVTWINKTQKDNKKYTSFFYAKSAREAMSKFYDGKNENDFHITMICENPMS